MKKAIAISFLSIYLFSTTELHQLLKLPQLVQHFLEHKAENRQMGFIAFLQLHYASGDVKDADYDKDQQLPFKADVNCFQAISSATLPAELNWQLLPPVRYVITKNHPYTDDSLLPSFPNNIWQPPRV